jgi:hypothetical protein
MMRERSGWRELDSNHRSRGRPRRSRGIGSRLRRLSVGGESSRADMSPSRNLLSRGTDGSNPASSSGESANFRFLCTRPRRDSCVGVRRADRRHHRGPRRRPAGDSPCLEGSAVASRYSSPSRPIWRRLPKSKCRKTAPGNRLRMVGSPSPPVCGSRLDGDAPQAADQWAGNHANGQFRREALPLITG